jgi:hypothetical protein
MPAKALAIWARTLRPFSLGRRLGKDSADHMPYPEPSSHQ